MRVSDDTLATMCGIIAKTESIKSDPETAPVSDILRLCALDLRDARAEMIAVQRVANHLCRVQHKQHGVRIGILTEGTVNILVWRDYTSILGSEAVAEIERDIKAILALTELRRSKP